MNALNIKINIKNIYKLIASFNDKLGGSLWDSFTLSFTIAAFFIIFVMYIIENADKNDYGLDLNDLGIIKKTHTIIILSMLIIIVSGILLVLKYIWIANMNASNFIELVIAFLEITSLIFLMEYSVHIIRKITSIKKYLKLIYECIENELQEKIFCVNREYNFINAFDQNYQLTAKVVHQYELTPKKVETTLNFIFENIACTTKWKWQKENIFFLTYRLTSVYLEGRHSYEELSYFFSKKIDDAIEKYDKSTDINTKYQHFSCLWGILSAILFFDHNDDSMKKFSKQIWLFNADISLRTRKEMIAYLVILQEYAVITGIFAPILEMSVKNHIDLINSAMVETEIRNILQEKEENLFTVFHWTTIFQHPECMSQALKNLNKQYSSQTYDDGMIYSYIGEIMLNKRNRR